MLQSINYTMLMQKF